MGLRPGESDCSRCLLRPKDQGGTAGCPFKNTLYPIYSQAGERGTCPEFREGDYKPRVKPGQEEALF